MFKKLLDLKSVRAYGIDFSASEKYRGWSVKVYTLAKDFIKKTDVVLDMASGSGLGTSYIAPYCQKIYGIDLDQGAIESAKKRFKAENLVFQTGDCTNLKDVPSGLFDKILTFETIEHMYPDEREKYLREIWRVLKKDGLILLSTPYNGTHERLHHMPWIRHPYGHKIEFYFDELKRELDPLFEIVQHGGIYNAKAPHQDRVALNDPIGGESFIRELRFAIRGITPERVKYYISALLGHPVHIRNYPYKNGELNGCMAMFLALKKK